MNTRRLNARELRAELNQAVQDLYTQIELLDNHTIQTNPQLKPTLTKLAKRLQVIPTLAKIKIP